MKLEAKIKMYKERLENIANSQIPINPNAQSRHEERVRLAKNYISELNSFIFPENARVVNSNVFDRSIEDDGYWIVDEGAFVRIAATIKYSQNKYTYIVHLTPYNML